MTLELEPKLAALGSEVPRSRFTFAKRGEPESVGVGGVATIMGAGSPGGGGGGVDGALLVLMGDSFPVRGRSGEDVTEFDLSGKIPPSLEATLLRLLSAALLSFCNCSSPSPSGLVLGLGPRLPGLRASFSLRPGEGDRF